MGKIESFFEFFADLRMTLVSGCFLAMSLMILFTKTDLPLDPAWVSVLISGTPIAYIALKELFSDKKITSELLVSTAMVASIVIGELFAAGEIAVIMAIGAILEHRTVERAKRGIYQLISLAPQQGRRLTENGEGFAEEMVAVDEILKGDRIRVLPGETVPVDGKIIRGNTSIDQSVMTGESLPVDKGIGDEVFSGTINRFGAIDMLAEKVGEDSSLQKLIRMVQEAEENKAPTECIVDRWASWLVPIAFGIAVITWFATSDITRAVTVLVVFCPCALALATPTSVVAAIGQATEHGVLIKSGKALETMGKVDCIAFDKTGTLTHGNLTVSDILPLEPGWTERRLLQLAGNLEARSGHPLGKAIVAEAKEAGFSPVETENFRMIPGKGIEAGLAGEAFLCGSSEFLREMGIPLDEKTKTLVHDLRRQGKALVFIANKERCIGLLALSDTLRDEVEKMVGDLGCLGTTPVLLTGDHGHTAGHFAEKAGISKVHAELLPGEKVDRVRELQKAGHTVCMVGDGVNDAPALKIADVGVAMGTMGSDIAIDAADIALMGDEIGKIPYLKRLSNATIHTIRFNIILSMLINLVAITLSVLGVLTPVTGALVHNVGSVLVVLNAARLYDRELGGNAWKNPRTPDPEGGAGRLMRGAGEF